MDAFSNCPKSPILLNTSRVLSTRGNGRRASRTSGSNGYSLPHSRAETTITPGYMLNSNLSKNWMFVFDKLFTSMYQFDESSRALIVRSKAIDVKRRKSFLEF